MSETENIVAVKILDRNYKIKCPADEAYELQEAAEYLNTEIHKLRHGTQSSNIEGVTTVTALNVCHQLILLKKQQNKTIEDMHQKIRDLQEKIQNFLAVEEPIAV
ncbi:MAG: cell division protein ZapA [Gammaproteobacteria bacterium]|nr:cell division protein ZapA [Gammaproteobacteria bacterium]